MAFPQAGILKTGSGPPSPPQHNGHILGTHPSPFIAFIENPEAPDPQATSAQPGLGPKPGLAITAASSPLGLASELWHPPAFVLGTLPDWVLRILHGWHLLQPQSVEEAFTPCLAPTSPHLWGPTLPPLPSKVQPQAPPPRDPLSARP